MRSRRSDYTESTRHALVDSALELFTKRGYAGTSLDAIVKRARVTKGALYHHFSGKQALFEAAFNQVETAAMDRLSAAIDGDGPAWDRAMAGIRGYVRVCLDPAYQRVVIHEAPVVMGWERWREAEEHFSYGLVRGTVEALVQAGEIEPLPVEVTARILFGALSAGAEAIAGSSDPKATAADVTRTIVAVMTGMRRAAP
ncbi:TetR/AcrR family transcriptional regulator [Actinophytocola gossypii]|uniref:TetR/AcrR family transcriptional regulator n=1 Tax=Actinophytocola gossypii TaxID=2812003 RepID=A0ABT2J981_9PSEU|nr:TetR/AcrR family transcriptional regulator [Actinophytocola gossypii]MCT2584134.1 TetR/AcrR family transcriptional regulator [Actinophytocola gossypii]